MNYSEFYTSAKRMLIDSMVSIWFKGKAKEQEYMRYILSEEEPLLAEPVFQSIFPWEDSDETFEEHTSKLNILSKPIVESLGSERVEESLRFPYDRHPYKHQTKSWKTMLSGEGKTIVVTAGTGSGKTECFMIPVLQDIEDRNERDCVQAIFLYPLNALMKSQQKRIHAWCNALPNKITYAIYNGDTKETATLASTNDSHPQLISRRQIRQTPPQILFTNPTMLNYMLVRSEDKSILEKSKGKLKWILLDEAHTYTGSAAAELALQLRRVLDAFGVTIDQVNFAVTSATIGDEKDPSTEYRLKKFVSQLTGKPIESVVIIGGKRIIPQINETKATEAICAINQKYGTKLTLADIEKLRIKLNTNPALSVKEIVSDIEPKLAKDTAKSLEIIDALGEKTEAMAEGKSAALLPTRANFFVRSIGGVYACVNSECSRHKLRRIGLGNLTTYQNINCPTCKSQMLEVATCPSCGGAIVVGETSTSKGYRMHINVIDLDKDIFYETANESINDANDNDDTQEIKQEEVDGFTPFYYAKPESQCLRHHTVENNHIFNHKESRIEGAKEGTNDALIYKSLIHEESGANLCPHCGNSLGKLNYLRASATQMGRVLSTLLLDNAEGSDKKDSELLYDGKKYITFTDNRQGSARSAMGLNQDVERSWIRSSIFHKLADMRLDKIEPAGLTDDEEKTYVFLKSMEATLPPMMKSDLQKLEDKKQGNMIIPEASEVKWNDISSSLENNSDFRKLFYHLSNARGGNRYENASAYLKALLVDQFGWIPKRANSLENMGVVRLVYPELKKATCPTILASKGCKDVDWQNFLKICIDYVIRGGRHYMISGEYKEYLTQNTYTSAIYPKNSELRKDGSPVSKWPVLKKNVDGSVQEVQSRLVLLLCAVLGYDDLEKIDDEKIANVNDLLTQAWDFITLNILESVDHDNSGYMLDLLGSKVRLQLVDKGYLCPVDNVVVDVTFCGYSPRIDGYIGRTNFERFKVKTELEYPYFPFKTNDKNEEELINWIVNNFEKQKESGVFSDIHERIYNQKPIFIAAEHSAQQSREDLDRYEKQFNDGQLNVLSCSTTMEMGVDIGGISEVVMNNVPPKSANYLQRAGRAGRRNESKALALTFCAPNPIGSHTWKNPKYPITNVTETPLLKLESRQLIQRHVNSLVFADFVATQGGMRVTAQLQDFFDSTDGESTFDKFMIHIDKLIGGQIQLPNSSYVHLVSGTSLANVSISDAVTATKRDMLNVKETFDVHISSLCNSLEKIQEEGENNAVKEAIEHQKNNFLKKSLLTYLAENTFLPTAGIPTGLVECMLGLKNDSNYPTLHLSQAISSYSPGNQVVKNEWIYEPAGIKMKAKYDGNTSRYILQNCTKCGYTTINYGQAMNNCPKCGTQNSMHGIKNMSLALEHRFTEVVEPAAFSVAWGTKPTRKMNGTGSMNFIQPVLLEMEPWKEKTSSAKMTVRCSTSKSEILFYNRGRNGFGYAFCPYCGKMETERGLDEAENIMQNHKHLITGTHCEGGNSVRRHVLLVGRYQTDFVEIKIFDGDNSLVTDPETLYSLGVILSRKLTELLGVNDGEIDFGYDAGNHSIFIYDTALGGAGYSPLFREYKDNVLKMAYDALKQCDCERSCTKCLIDRQSQWYINYLNRQKALEWLEMELKSRIAPESIVSIVTDATAVTTDFATEVYQLSRNKDIKSVRIFVDNDYSSWQLSEFPYYKWMKQLSLDGIDAAFVLDKNVDFSKASTSDRTVLMSALFKNKFTYCQSSVPGTLKPLLSVSFNDGTKKLYFGENVNTSLSTSWGEGDVYSTMSDIDMAYVDIDSSQLFVDMTAVEGDGSIMFDANIKENCNVDSLFDTLCRTKSEKWSKIISFFQGKTVSVDYSDRYLMTPLGCMLLAHMISSLKTSMGLNIQNINVHVIKPEIRISNSDYTDIDKDFGINSDRNHFLEDAIYELVGVSPRIIDDVFINHSRCLTIKSDTAELCIRPDGGIAYGWKPLGRNYMGCRDIDFRCNWNMEMSLYNQQGKYSGILYTVSFKKN